MADFADYELDLGFSGDEQEEQEVRGEMDSTTSNPRSNNEDLGKTDTDRDDSEASDGYQSESSRDTEEYAVPWRRRSLLAKLSPSSERYLADRIQQWNKSQLFVPASQSTGNPNLQTSAELLPLGLHQQPQVGPSQRVDLFTCRIEAIGPLARKELEMDSDTSVVPDSQDEISLLGWVHKEKIKPTVLFIM